MAKNKKPQNVVMPAPWAIDEIRVAGFKSISDEQSITVRPLTFLAGANSSGKSSMMQPLLLLKQTLEASYDPGPLLLNGPNVKFTSADQLLSRVSKGHTLSSFHVSVRGINGYHFQNRFRKEGKLGFEIEQMEISGALGTFTFWQGMSQAEIIATGITQGKEFSDELAENAEPGKWAIWRERCFLEPIWVGKQRDGIASFRSLDPAGNSWEMVLPDLIHLPGLRGNPERTYPVAAAGPLYPGTFEKYSASVISQWIEERDARIAQLNHDLRLLRLAGGVSAVRVNDVQIELQVGRLPGVSPARPEDRVSIADVGIGVSQTLPVLVALHVAGPDQLVYVEQPEAHLHPRAQFDLGQVLASAANRGVRVVVETHSSMLLLGVQTLVAEGKLTPDKIKLHWFGREKDGRTTIQSADLDESGRFGDWPEDFDDVTLAAQKRYLDAAERHLFAQ